MNPISELIHILSECADICGWCADSCLKEDDVKHLAECIKLNIDCAQICQVTAAFLSRGSGNADRLLKECEVICRKCAAECETHSAMEHCRKCAEICSKCADACELAK